MQQLEIVYSGIKVQYWLEEVQGLPLRSCLCLILTKKKTKRPNSYSLPL